MVPLKDFIDKFSKITGATNPINMTTIPQRYRQLAMAILCSAWQRMVKSEKWTVTMTINTVITNPVPISPSPYKEYTFM